MEIIFFSIIPATSVGFLFLKDANTTRKWVLNGFLLFNALLFLFPILVAYTNTPAGESMWNENTGGGSALWLYILILPITAIAQLVMLILKLV